MRYCVLLFLLLAACAGPPPVQLPVVQGVLNESVVTMPEMMTVIDTSQQDVMMIEANARALVDGWQDWNASVMYPVLSVELQGRVSAKQLQGLMGHFPPKDRTYVLLKIVNKTSAGYHAVVYRGNDYLGWERHEVPFIFQKDTWHAVLFDDITTVDGLVTRCQAKTDPQPGDTPEVAQGKAHSASSCLFNAAIVLRNASLCGHAVYDQEACFERLGVQLDKAGWVDVCDAASSDTTTRARCLRRTANRLEDVSLCRRIPTNRTERYMCLGEVAAVLREPWECNDAMNDHMLKLCAKTYVEKRGSFRDMCDNEPTKVFYDC